MQSNVSRTPKLILASRSPRRRELLAAEIHAVLRPGLTEPEIQAAAERLLNLAA